jgi:hypothetical protein
MKLVNYKDGGEANLGNCFINMKYVRNNYQQTKKRRLFQLFLCADKQPFYH